MVLRSFVSVSGRVMGGQIGLVYVTPHWFDENMLHSLTLRLAVNVILQLVLRLHNFCLVGFIYKI